MTKGWKALVKLADIGRPGIGWEFLRLYANENGRFVLQRYKRVNSQRDELRQMDLSEMPASAMIYDLLGAIEAIAAHAEKTDIPILWSYNGLDGNQPSLRQRLEKLSKI